MSFFELATRLYEVRRLDAKLFGDGDEVGFVGLEEAKERSKEFRLCRAGAQLVSPDSGQIEEPLRPPFVAKRCGKRS